MNKEVEDLLHYISQEVNLDFDTLKQKANDYYDLNSSSSTNIELFDYTEKSFVITGDGTKSIKEILKENGGKWNSNLSKDGKKFGGWIFSKTKKDDMRKLLKIPLS
jgi:hypothetical protein